jgi:putative ABC transport system permease protein
MRILRRTWKRLTGTFASARRERELAAELEAHLEMQTEDNLARGLSPAEARRQALLKFGGVESAKESYRDQRGLPQLDALAQDTRYAFRAMRKNPGFTAVAVLSLALGIAATTAIFSIVNSTLLAPLPYGDPGRLVTISLDGAITAPLFESFRQEARSLEQAALFVNVSLNLAGSGEPERVPAARVSAGLFNLLGAQPRLGRTFTAEEDQPGRDAVVVIGDGLWKRRFGGDPRVLGRKVIVNGVPQTIVGIMPPGFQFPDGPELPSFVGPFPPAQIWRPMALADWERTCAGCFNFGMIARLRPGVPPEAARAELLTILKRVSPQTRNGATGPDLAVRTLQDAISSQTRTPVFILFGAVAVALLIACVNVANLLVARGLRRHAEIAMRISLGAARARIVRQLLTESLVLAVCSAALAIPLAVAGIRALIAIAPAGIPGIAAATLDARVLAFTFGLALLTTLLFGTAPALATARRDPVDALKSGGRGAAGARSSLRPALIVAEFALSLVLVVAASLLAKTFVTVARTPLGFHAENVLTMRLDLPDTKYDDRRRAAFIDQLTANCAALPGVISSAAVSTLPLTGESEGWGLATEDRPDHWTGLRARAIPPAYFGTLGIRLRSGRPFTANDRGAAPVAIISATAAKRLWPGVANPIGRRFKVNPPMTVVGIVDDTRASGLDAEVRPYLYVPFTQFSPEEFALTIRSAADPAALAAAAKSEIWRLDKDQPITHVAVMRQLVADSIAPRRFQAVLMGLFAGFALLLAAVGIYGVVAYSVAQRTHEIGIRMALGASRADILAGVLFRAVALALTGAALGLAAAYELTPLLRGLLYGVNAVEPSVFAASALLLVAVAALAGFLPALRAARVDPMVCLRYE